MSNNNRLHQLQELLKAEPQDAFLNYAFAIELEKEGELNEAIIFLKNMLVSHSNYLPIYYKLGKLLENNSQIEEAKNIYLKGKEIASIQNNKKTLSELDEAIWMLED